MAKFCMPMQLCTKARAIFFGVKVNFFDVPKKNLYKHHWWKICARVCVNDFSSSKHVQGAEYGQVLFASGIGAQPSFRLWARQLTEASGEGGERGWWWVIETSKREAQPAHPPLEGKRLQQKRMAFDIGKYCLKWKRRPHQNTFKMLDANTSFLQVGLVCSRPSQTHQLCYPTIKDSFNICRDINAASQQLAIDPSSWWCVRHTAAWRTLASHVNACTLASSSTIFSARKSTTVLSYTLLSVGRVAEVSRNRARIKRIVVSHNRQTCKQLKIRSDPKHEKVQSRKWTSHQLKLHCMTSLKSKHVWILKSTILDTGGKVLRHSAVVHTKWSQLLRHASSTSSQL